MDTDDLIDEFLRDPNAREMYEREPQFSMQVKWLKQMLHLFDAALDTEGIPPWMRNRVLRVVLRGSVEDPADARHRMLMTMARIQETRLPPQELVLLPTEEGNRDDER
jgi:hypothetical protein